MHFAIKAAREAALHYQKGVVSMANYDLKLINARVKNAPDTFIAECENAYRLQLDSIVKDIENEKGRVLVMLAGPSSSGKTTTAGLLKQKIISSGKNASVISLDDFYLINGEPYTFEDGTIDYERVDALDVPMITFCLHELMEKGESNIPEFSFQTKKRTGFRKMKIARDEVLIVEGLHALNPVITEPLKNENMKKLYVSVSSRITDGEEILFTKRDLRFIRRMIRDYRHRSTEVEYTFYLWKGVRMGEDRYLFPFSKNADVRIDSIHPYEISVFRNRAIGLLESVSAESIYFERAEELIKKLSLCESLDLSLLPDDSLLREFI